MFALASVALLISALVLRSNESTGLDIYLHDTYFVVLHPRLLLAAGVVQGIYAVIYFVFPALTRDSFREALGRFHFLLTTIATAMIVAAPFLASMEVQPRYSTFTAARLMGTGAIFFLAGQGPFFLLFVRDKAKRI